MTIRTVTSTLLIFALPLLMLGCDGGGSAMEQEPQQMEELKLSIYHPPESNAQTNVTINRSASELQSGDLLNIFVTGDNEREAFGVEYPNSGNTTEVTFTVPAGDYDVDLLGFREFTNGNENFNSAIVFATTGTGQSVDVNSGEVITVDFRGGGSNQGGGDELLSKFNLSFDAELEFNGNSQGNKPRALDVTLKDENENNASGLADRIFESGTDASLGGIGIDPDKITQGDRSSATDNQDFTSIDGATLITDAFNLPPGNYRSEGNNSDLIASILLQLRIDDKYWANAQGTVYLYNNVDGSAQSDVNIGDDGGIIVII